MAAHSLAWVNLPCSWLISPRGALQCKDRLFPSTRASGGVSSLHWKKQSNLMVHPARSPGDGSVFMGVHACHPVTLKVCFGLGCDRAKLKTV